MACRGYCVLLPRQASLGQIEQPRRLQQNVTTRCFLLPERCFESVICLTRAVAELLGILGIRAPQISTYALSFEA